VNLTNWLGCTARSRWSVTKSFADIPKIMVSGTLVRYISRYEELVVSVTTQGAVCATGSDGQGSVVDGNRSNLAHNWTQLTAYPFDAGDDGSSIIVSP
jgi:hypothetical protein